MLILELDFLPIITRSLLIVETHFNLGIFKREQTVLWIFKVFFQDDGEFFEYDPLGMRGPAGTEKALPYPESLLSFLELDAMGWEPLVQQAALDLGQFLSTGDTAHTDHMMQTLGELGAQHICFQLLYLRYFERTAAGNLKPKMTGELRLLSGQLTAYQKQAQTFLERILDIDQAGREVQQNTRAAYFFDQPHDTALFRFEPIPHQLWCNQKRRLWGNPILQHNPGPDRLLSPRMHPTGHSGSAP